MADTRTRVLGLEVTLPIRVESVANKREHWAVKARRTQTHRHLACALTPYHPLPVIVTITRIAPRELDDDNLQYGCKALRDGIADRLGVDDRDKRVEWRYAQAKGKPHEYAAHVKLEPKGE